MTSKRIERLIKQLHTRQLAWPIHDEFVELGQEAFDELMAAIRSRDLSDLQTVNALAILLRLRHFDERGFFAAVLELIGDDRKKVRSAAAGMAVGLVIGREEFGRSNPEGATRDVVEPLVREAIDRGVEPGALDSLVEFLSSAAH